MGQDHPINYFRTWIERLTTIGHLPVDTEDELLRKSALTVLVFPFIFVGFIWGIMYIAMGFVVSGMIPFGYAVFSALSLIHFSITKRYGFFRFTQLLLILILPFLLQWSLGGIVLAGGMMLWAILAPIGALTFQGAKKAIPWFIVYIALICFSGLLDYFGLVGETLIHQSGIISPTFMLVVFLMNFICISSMAFISMYHFVQAREQAKIRLESEHRLLQIEQDKSDRLLLNVLPKPIADRLKKTQTIIADGYAEVSVLFADIVGFTPMSEKLSPTQLVELLNEVFSAFDQLAERHGLEKIKTIGDAYMVVGGLPTPQKDHLDSVADMALDMQLEILRLNTIFGSSLDLRIGIHTGPVVAGVIGIKKFIYDVWGDTVNTASRMESHSLPGGIQVTETTYQPLQHKYVFEQRGLIEVKGKGSMVTYFLKDKIASGERFVAKPGI